MNRIEEYREGEYNILRRDNVRILYKEDYRKSFNDYRDYILELITDRYNDIDFVFILEEDRFIFQYAHNKIPISQGGIGPELNKETLSKVIELIETSITETEQIDDKYD